MLLTKADRLKVKVSEAGCKQAAGCSHEQGALQQLTELLLLIQGAHLLCCLVWVYCAAQQIVTASSLQPVTVHDLQDEEQAAVAG